MASLDAGPIPQRLQALPKRGRGRPQAVKQLESEVEQLDFRARVAPETAAERWRRLQEFKAFVDGEGGDWVALWAGGPAVVAEAIIDFAERLYQGGRPVYVLRNLVLGVQDVRRHWRGCLGGAWDAVRIWQDAVPHHHRVALPRYAFEALMGVVLAWRWYDVAAVLMVGWAGALRPGEMAELEVADVLLPCDLGRDGGPGYSSQH